LDVRPWIIAPLLLVWLAASVFILIGRGDVESLLDSAFGHRVMSDAFEGLNQIAPLCWASHSMLVSLALVAAWRRRADILLVLVIGPGIALLLCLVFERWSDPNWHDVLAVCSIGWFVGTLVTGFYWLANRRRRSDDRPL